MGTSTSGAKRYSKPLAVLVLLWSATSSSAGTKRHMSQENLLAALTAGQTLNERPDYLAVALPSMFQNGVCQAPDTAASSSGTSLGDAGPSEPDRRCGIDAKVACVSPCWVQASKSPLEVTAVDGTALTSLNSQKIIRGCAKDGIEFHHHPTLIATELMVALFRLDPHSFFLCYISGGKLIALPTPTRVVSLLPIASPLCYSMCMCLPVLLRG